MITDFVLDVYPAKFIELAVYAIFVGNTKCVRKKRQEIVITKQFIGLDKVAFPQRKNLI